MPRSEHRLRRHLHTSLLHLRMDHQLGSAPPPPPGSPRATIVLQITARPLLPRISDQRPGALILCRSACRISGEQSGSSPKFTWVIRLLEIINNLRFPSRSHIGLTCQQVKGQLRKYSRGIISAQWQRDQQPVSSPDECLNASHLLSTLAIGTAPYPRVQSTSDLIKARHFSSSFSGSHSAGISVNQIPRAGYQSSAFFHNYGFEA